MIKSNDACYHSGFNQISREQRGEKIILTGYGAVKECGLGARASELGLQEQTGIFQAGTGHWDGTQHDRPHEQQDLSYLRSHCAAVLVAEL